ncbi:malectin domain-containing carbohydrate-binding protein [Parabacteroides sp.]|uniref:malectin domain-containing carbohydrate-binding protein n=1 Tax=Parabacteroides sp. TaxID=1869337 RepID=UPI0030810301
MQAQEVKQIVLPYEASRLLNFSAKEIQKYIYLRTKLFVPIQSGEAEHSISEAIVLRDDNRLSTEEYSIETKGNSLYISGGSDIAVLYGVYSYAELLGVRFALHGDVIPDEPFRGSLLQCEKKNGKPLFALRGLLPFHDFPEGPDLWNEDMYKLCMAQMVKMKMNFFSLHTYPHVEPNVWVGLSEDTDEKGNVTYSYPTTLANTSRPGAWGYSAMDTRDYCCGASTLFKDSVYASPLVEGLLPWPNGQEQMNEVFNRTGTLWDDAFSFGKQLGIRFCVGLETPLSIPKEVTERLKEKNIDPGSREAKQLLYKGIFSRIQKRHPLDYFWLWTPEGWTWGTPSKESIQSTVEDVRIARSVLSELGDPFGFGLSGWVLGPPNDTKLFDRHLPAGDFMSSLSRLVGQERIDLGYKELPDSRMKMPVLWLEDDPALTTPQFWAGRLRSDIAESYAAGCSGIVGNFWRTRSIAPNIIAMAEACWEQEDWNSDFGKPYQYVPEPTNDIRIGGVGTNYYRHIKGTEDQYLYNTQRYDLEGFKVKVPNGNYKVTFLFSETKFDRPGQRVFHLKVQDSEVLRNIDVFKAAGRDSAYTITSGMVKVDNYTLDIQFEPVVGPTFLSGFVIEGKTADVNQIKGTPYRRCIDVGGGLYKDFEADLSEQVGNKQQRPRDMSATSLYQDYACHEFGSEVGNRVAAIFESLDGTVGNEGHLGFRMPRPAAWITGPGVIQPNEIPWEEEAGKYAFVDSLYALRDQVKGKGNKARFDYWLNTFSCLRAMGELGCMRGLLDNRMKELSAQPSEKAKRSFVEDKVLPLRIDLSRKWEQMIGYLMQTVYTSGELGTLINLESQTRKTYGFLTKYDQELEVAYGKKLPTEIYLSETYSQSSRLIVLNERTVIGKGEAYKMEVTVLGTNHIDEVPVLMYRELGKGKFKAKKMTHEKQQTFSVQLPDSTEKTIEYYITMNVDGKNLSYPASAPEVNSTWVKL